jgi:hypothetical protein
MPPTAVLPLFAGTPLNALATAWIGSLTHSASPKQADVEARRRLQAQTAPTTGTSAPAATLLPPRLTGNPS